MNRKQWNSIGMQVQNKVLQSTRKIPNIAVSIEHEKKSGMLSTPLMWGIRDQ